MSRNALLGLALVILTIAGLALGIARLAPRGDAAANAIAAAAALAGAGAFGAVLRLGRRGRGGARWLLLPGLAAIAFLDRLPERWQLALLGLAAGYVAAFVLVVSVRALRPGRQSR
jgi:hypothetical protein